MVKKNIAVLFGGASNEHEISCLSAFSVINGIDEKNYNIHKIGITKKGEWFLFHGQVQNVKDGSWVKGPCTPCAFAPGRNFNGLTLFESDTFKVLPIDVIIPILHGKNAEDGTIQGLLELCNIPYVGCDTLSSAICMDKIIANCVMSANDIPHCKWDYMLKSEMENFDEIEKRVSEKLSYPIFVKPSASGSSVGISKATDKQSLKKAVELALQHDDRILFEEFINGQEVECAVIGNDDVKSTLPGEILASKEFYDYEDKYLSGQSKTAIPANLNNEKLNEIKLLAEKAYKALACKGLSRVDFFVEKNTGKVYLNEINTMPGFTNISMYPKMMINSGYTFSSLFDALIKLAVQRHEAVKSND